MGLYDILFWKILPVLLIFLENIYHHHPLSSSSSSPPPSSSWLYVQDLIHASFVYSATTFPAPAESRLIMYFGLVLTSQSELELELLLFCLCNSWGYKWLPSQQPLYFFLMTLLQGLHAFTWLCPTNWHVFYWCFLIRKKISLLDLGWWKNRDT